MTDDESLIEAMLDSWYPPETSGGDWRKDAPQCVRKCKKDMAALVALVRAHDAAPPASEQPIPPQQVR